MASNPIQGNRFNDHRLQLAQGVLPKPPASSNNHQPSQPAEMLTILRDFPMLPE